jgi:hypothetical protein
LVNSKMNTFTAFPQKKKEHFYSISSEFFFQRNTQKRKEKH